jgi:hypothetical protein
MSRIRTIKPEFPQSESIGRLSRDARLLFIELWTVCDDEGKTRGSSRMLASLLFPYDEDAPDLMNGWLVELEREKMIVRYQVDGATYVKVCKWNAHQKIDRPSKSRLPDPRGAVEKSREDDTNDREGSSLDLGPRTVDLVPRTASPGDAALYPVSPQPEGLTPLMVADAVLKDCKISGMNLRVALEATCRHEMDDGTCPDELRASLVGAWQDYEEAKPNLKYFVGAEKFFGQRIWRNRAGWPWKDGHAASQRKPLQVKTPDKPVHEFPSNAISIEQIRATVRAAASKGVM